jgi:predicted CXXCH cytochrome family protein
MASEALGAAHEELSVKRDPTPPLRRASLALLATLFLGAATPLAGAEELDSSECLECHGDDDGMLFTFADGSSLPIYVDGDAWEHSIHGSELTCLECHRNINDIPHGDLEHGSAREYQIALAETCKRCHYAHYSRSLDGIHYEMLSRGESGAPTCVDCHSAHATVSPASEPSRVDQSCAGCHEDIATAYRSSVHGGGDDAVPGDLPGCTDCHGAHSIRDPRNDSFHASSYTICARCHGDAERMERYGLNAGVLDTYLADFHGASNKLYTDGAGKPTRKLAVCTDCHGVHDIQSLQDLKGTEAMQAHVLEMCQRCHEEVPAGFADAWLSHYEPSLETAPLVWVVRTGYRALIPLILVGLVMHILLHLWRLRPQNIIGG